MAIVRSPEKIEHVKRYNQLAWWGQFIINYPFVWQYVLPAIPALWGLLNFFIFIATGNVFLLLFALLGFGLTGAYLYGSIEIIKESDDGKPQFGLLEVLGLRLPVVYDEGIALKIPLISRIVRRSKEQFNDDLVIPSTKCRLEPITKEGANKFYEQVAYALNESSPPDIQSGGSVKTTLGFTFERDWTNGWAVLDYDNVGETEGFLDISRDAIEEDLREVGRRLTWLQATFATDLISAHLIIRLTGETEETKKMMEEPTPAKIAAFLEDVRVNGRSYIKGLGVNIRRVQAKSIDPIGKLADASEQAAVEEMRRQGLLKNVDALADAVERLKSKFDDKSMTYKDLVNTVQVDEEGSRVEKKIVEIAGNGDALDKLIAGLSGLTGRK